MSVKRNVHGGENTSHAIKGWKLRFLRLMALLIVACVGLTACGKKQENTVQEPFTVKIGVLLDFGGDKKAESEEMYRAISLAADEINSSGGVLTEGYKIELLKKDDEGDYMKSVAGYYQLVQEGACAVIGTNNSEGMEELIKASASANVSIITPSVTDDLLVSAANFVYQACFSDKYMTQALAKLLALEQNKSGISQSVALVCLSEDERYVSLYGDMAASLNSYGIETVYAGEVSGYTEDNIRQTFEKIVSSGAQNVFLPDSPDNIEKLLDIAKKTGYKGAFIGLPEWYEYDGDTYGYNIYVPVNMAVDRDDKAVKDFLGSLGDVTSDGVRPAYDAVYFIRDAIESGYLATPASIALKLPFLEGSTVLGDYSIGAYGNTEKTVDIILMHGREKSYMATMFE